MQRPDGRRKRRQYDFEFKLRLVKAIIERKLSAEEVRETYGVWQSTWLPWRKVYLEGGEVALEERTRKGRSRKPKVPDPGNAKLKEQVVEVKKEHPYFGVVRVWQWLRRMFFSPASYQQVRETMKEENLVQPATRRKRRPSKPKRYERAKPNQMWCSDITEFTIGRGLMVHLIAFMDDHSRYIVAWGLYAACTTDLVLEVLKNGFDSYGYPEELLTDNGPQYKTWRGVTKFQKTLLRENIRHVLCGRHYPQGNGKIEAFWAGLKKEFVHRAPLGSLEEVRERISHWFTFYNWQRPHGELEWATPAERYFQFADDARREIEKRIKERVKNNEEQLAFSQSIPSVGKATAGGKAVEVAREGDAFVVRIDGKEVKRTTLNPKEETNAAQTNGVAGGDEGRRSEDEGRGRAVGAVGREVDRGDLPADRAQADPVLQDGSTPRGSDDDSRRDAGDAGAKAQPARGGDDAGREDGDPERGASAHAESREDHPQAEVPAEAPRQAAKDSAGTSSSDAVAKEE
jgi:transposase InsO family protein